MTNVCVVCRGEIYTCEVAGAGRALGWDGDPQDYIGERVPEHWHHRGAGGHPARPAWKAQQLAIGYEPDEHITEIFRQTFGGNYS